MNGLDELLTDLWGVAYESGEQQLGIDAFGDNRVRVWNALRDFYKSESITPFDAGKDWMPVHRNTLKSLDDHRVLLAGMGKLSPDLCKKAGMTEAESRAVEAMWSLLSADDFYIITPAEGAKP